MMDEKRHINDSSHLPVLATRLKYNSSRIADDVICPVTNATGIFRIGIVKDDILRYFALPIIIDLYLN